MRQRSLEFLQRMERLRRPTQVTHPGPYTSRRDWETKYFLPCWALKDGFVRIAYSWTYAGG